MTQDKNVYRLSVVLGITLSVGIIFSLFFKMSWLWMDEVLSYLLVSDPSVAHMNQSVVSGMDANPPLFANLYWFIGHTVSLNPQFLRAVSVVLFALTMALFQLFISTLIGTPITNFVLITGIVALTYLNLMLSTQIRAYSLFLLVSFGYFVALHHLLITPNQLKRLAIYVLLGVLLVLTHNFGLFYLAASGSFVVVLVFLVRRREYIPVLIAHATVGLVWLLVWYPSFAIQTEAGKPHSWIPLPTFSSFFRTVGELVPNLSANLELRPLLFFLPIVRVAILGWLFVAIALPRLRAGFQAFRHDYAFLFYLLTGWLFVATVGLSLVVSLTHTSVFISRYLWPNHLLVIYQLVYAWYHFRDRWSLPIKSPRWATRLLPAYVLLLAAFLFVQNRRVVIFPTVVLKYLPQLDKRYPVFVETADYFLPIWFQDKSIKVHYLLDWETAAKEGNQLSATVEHKILKSVRANYPVTGILTLQDFNRATVPHFYVIDEGSHYQIEHFIQTGRIRVIRQLPIDLPDHRILECTFQS